MRIAFQLISHVRFFCSSSFVSYGFAFFFVCWHFCYGVNYIYNKNTIRLSQPTKKKIMKTRHPSPNHKKEKLFRCCLFLKPPPLPPLLVVCLHSSQILITDYEFMSINKVRFHNEPFCFLLEEIIIIAVNKIHAISGVKSRMGILVWLLVDLLCFSSVFTERRPLWP